VLRDFRVGKEPTSTSDSTYAEHLLEEARTFLRDIGWPVDAERAERVARIALTVHCKAEVAFNTDEAADGDVDVAVSFLLDELHQSDEIVKHTTREAASVVLRSERSEHSRYKGPFEEAKITKDDDPATARAEDKAAVSADTQNESILIINNREEGGITDPAPNQCLYEYASSTQQAAHRGLLAEYVSKDDDDAEPDVTEQGPQHVHHEASPFTCIDAPEVRQDPAQTFTSTNDEPLPFPTPIRAPDHSKDNAATFKDGYIDQKLLAGQPSPTTASHSERGVNSVETAINTRNAPLEASNGPSPSLATQPEHCTNEHDLSDSKSDAKGDAEQRYQPSVPALRWHNPVPLPREGRFDVRLPRKFSGEGRQCLPLLCWPANLPLKENQLFSVDVKDGTCYASSTAREPQCMRVHMSGNINTPNAEPFIVAAPGAKPTLRLVRCRLSRLHLLILKTFVDDDIWNAVGECRDALRARGGQDAKDIALHEGRRGVLKGLTATTGSQVEEIMGQVEEAVRGSEALMIMMGRAGRLLVFVDGEAGQLTWVEDLGGEGTEEAFWVVEG
ncbi:hypothetical protein LTS18_000439, partial [Coniosporium uncinatum]